MTDQIPAEALDLLDEMNAEGRIEYEDYSRLHDTIAVLRPESSEVQHLWHPHGDSMCGVGGKFSDSPDLEERLLEVPVCTKCFVAIRQEQRDRRWGVDPSEDERGVRQVPLTALLAVYRDGDERGWQAEFDWLWSERGPRLDVLATSIQESGIQEPVLLGTDGRVWDGHHRLAVAHRLGIEVVPVIFTAGFTRRPMPSREQLIDLLRSEEHAPMSTHDPRDGSCRECPWPVHMLPPEDIADAVIAFLEGKNDE